MTQNNLHGSLYMVFAMACFAAEDAFIKAAAHSVPLGLIILLFGVFGTLIFSLLCHHHKEPILHRAMLSRPILLRAFFEMMGRLFFSISLVLIPLSTLSAILQSTPLVVVAGAALFLGEKADWRRWLLIIIGFFGVLFIIRPGLDGFQPASIFAVLGTLGFAGRDLTTRAAPKVLSNRQLGVYGFFILIPAGLILLFLLPLISGGMLAGNSTETASLIAVSSTRDLLYIAATIIFGVAAYYSLTIAMRVGEVAVVTPFRYTRLIFALIISMIFFAERPDALTLVGSAIIIMSGIYTLTTKTTKSPSV